MTNCTDMCQNKGSLMLLNEGVSQGVSGGAIDSVKREGFSSPRPSGHILSLFDDLIPSDEACEDIIRKKHFLIIWI